MIRLLRAPRPPLAGDAWQEGDVLLAVDDQPVGDLLDLYFHAPAGPDMVLTVADGSGRKRRVRIAAGHLPQVTECLAPMEFATCACRCVFCFIDQNPPGLRPSLYVKDEDWRLSFLYGNYVTLTSVGRSGLERICAQKLSPLYVSVHATDPEVRSRMLGVRKRAGILDSLDRLAAAGITVHAQVVLCPGWNDGAVLGRTFDDLVRRHPAVGSLAIVPVGLTRHRLGLTRLSPVSPELAAALVRQVARWQEQARRQTGCAFVYLSDEFYLLARQPFPGPELYEDFPQLDNGVGLTVRLQGTWSRALRRAHRRGRRPRRPITILTGQAAQRTLAEFLAAEVDGHGLPRVTVCGIGNGLYGPRVTVAGLLAGRDIRRALLALPAEPRRTVLLNQTMFNSDGLSLDGMDLTAITAGQNHDVRTVLPAGLIDFWMNLD